VRPLLIAACALLLLGGSASASNPWQLQCAAMPLEQPAPRAVRSEARRFFPWTTAKALHDGPVYLLALSVRTAISRDGDYTDSQSYYLHRALIAVAPSYTGRVTVAGHRLGQRGARAALGFATNGANHCAVANPVVTCGNRSLTYAPRLEIAQRRGWRIVQTELRIGRTGCFRLTATGTNLEAEIPLAVPGPDWGTPGW
jgi:hypothetical protein